jgi:hypothetical protein
MGWTASKRVEVDRSAASKAYRGGQQNRRLYRVAFPRDCGSLRRGLHDATFSQLSETRGQWIRRLAML